jgi:hypothetical protein
MARWFPLARLGPAGGGQTKPGGKGGISTGGKPRNQGGGKNNSQKKGTSQPKKAKAMLRAVGENIAMLVDTELSEEQITEISETFNHPADWIMTEATFKERFPDHDIITPWPELSTMESVAAATAASKIIASEDTLFKKLEADYRANNANGKRAYVSPQKKTEFEVLSRVTATFGHLKDQTGLESLDPVNRQWEHHYTSCMAALNESMPEAGEADREAFAWALCTARLKKSMKD